MLATWSWPGKFLNLIYTLIPLTVYFQLRMDHPELSISSEIQSLGGNKNQTGMRQIFQVNADCPAQGWLCVLQRTWHTLSSVISINACFFFNYPVISSPTNTRMERVPHIYTNWLTWGRELIYFGKWIWYLSSSSVFQIPFPSTAKLFANPALFS